MRKRLEKNACIQTIEAMIFYGFDVTVKRERVDGEPTDFVIVEARNGQDNKIGGWLDLSKQLV